MSLPDDLTALSPASSEVTAGNAGNAVTAAGAMGDARPCTCHPDDNPPRPCPQKFAYSECMRAALSSAESRLLTAEAAILPFRSGGEWGRWKAWLVNGAPTREEGIAAAKAIVRMQDGADRALLDLAPAAGGKDNKGD